MHKIYASLLQRIIFSYIHPHKESDKVFRTDNNAMIIIIVIIIMCIKHITTEK